MGDNYGYDAGAPENRIYLEKDDKGVYRVLNGYLEVIKTLASFEDAKEHIKPFGVWGKPYTDLGGFEMYELIETTKEN